MGVKVFFNTSAFKSKYKLNKISITDKEQEANLAVMGAKSLNFDSFANLKAVYRFGIGSENVPFEHLKARSIPVHFPSERAKSILFESTANWAVWLINRMVFMPYEGDAEKWSKNLRGLAGNKTLLVIGAGRIGQRVVAKLDQVFQVIAFDSLKNKPHELRPMIEKADIISLHIPGGKENENFFNTERLGWMKDDAVLVNTARGAVVDEEALYEKLSHSNCRAAFDVFWKETYNGKLKTLGTSKFFITPHTASSSQDFVDAAFEDILAITGSSAS